MHSEIRGTDIQWLAEGWWDHYFKHRRLSKTKLYDTIGGINFLIGAALLFFGFMTMQSQPKLAYFGMQADWPIAILVIGAVLGLSAIVLFYKSGSIEHRERDKFIDHIIDQWEDGVRDLPDLDTVTEYLKDHDLLD